MASRDDTIFALATPPGVAGVAVIRVSGPEAVRSLALAPGPLPAPRLATLRWLEDAGDRLDQALVLRFAAPASFTGEDVVEFHTHGGRAVVQSVLRALGSLGLRPAEPGEFTWRAHANGRLDLTAVEALGDLLHAETDRQRQQAISGVSGRVATLSEGWRDTLVEALALVEITLDWADEDVPEDTAPAVRTRLTGALDGIAGALAGGPVAERIRGGFEVALVGAPNAGKSTLLNALAGREVALATAVAGTTRDVLEVALDLDGLAVTLVDMAGLRAGGDLVERLGIDRATARADAADLRLFLHAPDAPLPEAARRLARPDDLHLATKADLAAVSTGDLAVSGATGLGLDALSSRIAAILGERAAAAGPVGHARQIGHLREAADAIRAAIETLETDPPEIVSEHIREALRALERLTGRAGPEAVLGAVFSRFCLGK